MALLVVLPMVVMGEVRPVGREESRGGGRGRSLANLCTMSQAQYELHGSSARETSFWFSLALEPFATVGH